MFIAASPPNRAWLRRARIAAIAAWGCALAAGWLWMKSEDFTASGSQIAARDRWPADSRIARDDERSTLVLFIHPKCPCTRATLAELERTLCRARATLPRTVVVASTPREAGDEWTDTPTLRRCRTLPDVDVVLDEGGVESARFGAAVSGTILVYDPTGRLRYAGGITASRGHEGGNPGAEALSHVLGNWAEPVSSCPPMGCRLVGERLADVTPAKAAAGSANFAAERILTADSGRAN